jgi:hypothetical protein
MIEDVTPYLREFDLELNKVNSCNYNWNIRKIPGSNINWTSTPDGKRMDNATRAWVWSLIGNKRADQKTLPDCVWSWDQQSCAALIAGYLATDGCVVKSVTARGWISFGSTSRDLLEAIARLLEYRFGVWTNPVYSCEFDLRRTMYQLSVTHPDAIARLKSVLQTPGVKAARLSDFNVTHTLNRHADLGCRVQLRRYIGELPVMDIEVDDPDHMYMLANGLISSNSKFATRKAGYIGKLFGMAVMDSVVTEDDCDTPYGIPVTADDDDNVGSILSRPVAGFPSGTVIDRNVMSAFKKKGIDKIIVRSPMTCGTKQGVCKHCVGVREGGELPPIGYHIGLNATSALAEQIAQNALNVKHSGKKAKGQTTYSGFDVIKNLATVPGTFPNHATVSENDGVVTKIVEAPQGGYHVYIDEIEHYVPQEMPVLVKEGDTVEAGDQLSDGIINPSDVVRLKGLGEGRRYFAERMTQAFRDTNFSVNRRNVEVLAKSLVNHVQVDDDAAGDHLPGDVVTYSSWANGYRPRPDSKRLVPKAAIGQYLEEPALHYTVGTRVTKSVADMLNKQGTQDVLAHVNPTGMSPVMMSVVKAPEYSDDWMARLGSSYLKTRLLEDVHSGAESNVHGINPIPGIAKGTEFGQRKGRKFTY